VQHISVLGTQIDIGSPDDVTTALWLGWLYWFWRYCTHYRAIKDHGMRSTFITKLLGFAYAEAGKRFNTTDRPRRTATVRGQ
jgi:hypothetical protein